MRLYNPVGFPYLYWCLLCGGIVALWSGPVGIQIDGLGSSLAGSSLYWFFFSIIFSSTFEIVGSKLTGREDETSIGFFLGLVIIIICAIFNDLGQYSRRSMALNIYIRFTSPSFFSSFNILAVIRSRPGAFFGGGLTFWFHLLLGFFFKWMLEGVLAIEWV